VPGWNGRERRGASGWKYSTSFETRSVRFELKFAMLGGKRGAPLPSFGSIAGPSEEFAHNGF
jgi:hypothetical protein